MSRRVLVSRVTPVQTARCIRAGTSAWRGAARRRRFAPWSCAIRHHARALMRPHSIVGMRSLACRRRTIDFRSGSFAADRCATKIGPCPQYAESDGGQSRRRPSRWANTRHQRLLDGGTLGICPPSEVRGVGLRPKKDGRQQSNRPRIVGNYGRGSHHSEAQLAPLVLLQPHHLAAQLTFSTSPGFQLLLIAASVGP